MSYLDELFKLGQFIDSLEQKNHASARNNAQNLKSSVVKTNHDINESRQYPHSNHPTIKMSA